jgi:hypothetical protein
MLLFANSSLNVLASCFLLLVIVKMQGTKTGTVSFTDAEGVPVSADINGKFMAVCTATGIIKVPQLCACAKELGATLPRFALSLTSEADAQRMQFPGMPLTPAFCAWVFFDRCSTCPAAPRSS